MCDGAAEAMSHHVSQDVRALSVWVSSFVDRGGVGVIGVPVFAHQLFEVCKLLEAAAGSEAEVDPVEAAVRRRLCAVAAFIV